LRVSKVIAIRDQHGGDGELQPGAVGGGEVEVVELVFDVQRQGLGLPDDVAGRVTATWP
jgi:hypothetical protein